MNVDRYRRLLQKKGRRDEAFALADATGNENRRDLALAGLVVHPLNDRNTAPRIIPVKTLLGEIRAALADLPPGAGAQPEYACAVDAVCKNKLSPFDGRLVRCAAGIEDDDWAASEPLDGAGNHQMQEVTCV